MSYVSGFRPRFGRNLRADVLPGSEFPPSIREQGEGTPCSSHVVTHCRPIGFVNLYIFCDFARVGFCIYFWTRHLLSSMLFLGQWTISTPVAFCEGAGEGVLRGWCLGLALPHLLRWYPVPYPWCLYVFICNTSKKKKHTFSQQNNKKDSCNFTYGMGAPISR